MRKFKYVVATLACVAITSCFANSSSNSNESTGQYISDSAITAKIKSVLIADKKVKSSGITVTTTHGVAKLKGTVPNKNQHQKIISDVKNVKGVKSVIDNLKVQH